MNNKLIELKDQIEALTQKIEFGEDVDFKNYEEVIKETINCMDRGEIAVCAPSGTNSGGSTEWVTNVWVKNAILYYFKIMPMKEYQHGPFQYYDKIPLKSNCMDLNIRVVPPATARHGSFMEPGVVLMPCYVNIGAYIGKNTMIDTWATVGSCARVGADVHISGGVGIGGVLEPVGAQPVIIEDGCFVGSRAIIVEGVRVGREAVIASNVSLTASTPIVDIRDSQQREIKGYVPERAVVVPGTKEKEVGGGKVFTSCAYIIGERKESTNKKTSLNDVLREFSIST